MRPYSGDTRLVFLAMMADDLALAGSTLVRLCRSLSRDRRISRQLHALEAAGLVARDGLGPIDQRIYRLTERGRSIALGAIDPEKLWSRPWVGTWTIVAFDVPEAAAALRTQFRRQLRELRFGWLQNSVWISPDPATDVTGLLGRHGIAPDSLTVFEGRPAGGENVADVVSAAWDFAKLEREYTSYRRLLDLRPPLTQHDALKWKKWAESEQRAWHRVCASDPFLPEALLPAGYSGRKAWRARLKALADLATALNGRPATHAVG